MISFVDKYDDYIKPANELPIPLHSDIPLGKIYWMGWEAHFQTIRYYWNVSITYNHYAQRYRVQIRNPDSHLIGVIKIPENVWNTAIYNKTKLEIGLDQIYLEYNGKTKRKAPRQKVLEPYTIDDVPMLLELVNILLEPSRKKLIDNTKLSTADILYLEKLKHG